MAPTSTTPSLAPSDLSALQKRLPLIGLTGGIGSGKTAVSTLLSDLGAGIVDADLIAHQLTAPNGKAIPFIAKEFGPDFIAPHGGLDRAKMRALVFEDPPSRIRLEQITHPLIRDEAIRQALELAEKGVPYIVFVVPLLVESAAWKKLVVHIIVVDCPEEAQIERVMQRSNLSRTQVQGILGAQAGRQERLSCADTIIENDGHFELLEKKVQDLHQKILNIAQHHTSSS